MQKFQVGKTYSTRLIGDSDLSETITIASRTASFITTTKGKRLGINKKRSEYAGAGWLRTPEQAATEMNATKAEREIIEQVFGASMRIGASSILKLAV